MGWFSKKEKVVETPEQKKQRFLDNQFKNLQDGTLFKFNNTFAIFNKKTGNIVNYNDCVLFNTVEKAVEVKGIMIKTENMIDKDLVIVKITRASFQIV